MHKSLVTALITVAACAADAAPSLSVTLTAPDELQLQETELFRVRIRNTHPRETAFTLVTRLNLPAGLDLVQPVPPGCGVVTEPLPGSPVPVRQVRCNSAGLGAGRTAALDLFVQATQAPAGQGVVVHRVHATSTSIPTATLSSPSSTQYANFSLPIVPNTMWTTQSCWLGDGSAPVPHGICTVAPNQLLEGTLRLASGGIVDSPDMPGPTGYTWLQTGPTVLRYDEPGDPQNGSPPSFADMRIVNSRCFRGQGRTLPPPGSPVWHTGVKLCRA